MEQVQFTRFRTRPDPACASGETKLDEAVTIRELAAEIGLSKTTVAAALRGNSEVSAATQALVRTRARELGYEFNPVASAFLQQVRARGALRYRANLAMMLPLYGEPSVARTGIQVQTLHQGMIERAAELGYSIDPIDPSEYSPAQLTRILVARGVLGIIIGPLARSVGHLSLNWSKFAVVALGYSLARPEVHRVVHNHLGGVRALVRQCRRKGFRRIGMVLNTDSNQRSNRLWSSGFWELQQRLPLADQVKPLLGHVSEHSPERIREWIREERPETVIFHNRMVIPNLPELQPGSPGYIVPVVLDRLPDDPYAGIDQLYRHLGSKVINVLSAQILHNERGIPLRPTITTMDGDWMDHPSFAR